MSAYGKPVKSGRSILTGALFARTAQAYHVRFHACVCQRIELSANPRMRGNKLVCDNENGSGAHQAELSRGT